MKEHWTPSTIGALIVIVGCLLLRFHNINSEVWASFSVAVGFLFGDQFRITRASAQAKNHKK